MFISMYLPESKVASSPESICALDPVIYISTFSFIDKLSTAF